MSIFIRWRGVIITQHGQVTTTQYLSVLGTMIMLLMRMLFRIFLVHPLLIYTPVKQEIRDLMRVLVGQGSEIKVGLSNKARTR